MRMIIVAAAAAAVVVVFEVHVATSWLFSIQPKESKMRAGDMKESCTATEGQEGSIWRMKDLYLAFDS